jgi:membrane-associated phospholipid phosphatase
MNWISFTSDLGDSAILVPLSLLLVAALWRYQSWSAAISFLWAAAFCAAVMFILKVLFLACGSAWQAGILSPSGHTSMSTTVYGTFVIVSARQAAQWRRPLIVAAGALLITIIALSRMMLGMHSPPEVMLGLLVGILALGIFAMRYFQLDPAALNLPLFLSASCVVLLILHGAHLPAEQLIRHFASLLRTSAQVCR